MTEPKAAKKWEPKPDQTVWLTRCIEPSAAPTRHLDRWRSFWRDSNFLLLHAALRNKIWPSRLIYGTVNQRRKYSPESLKLLTLKARHLLSKLLQCSMIRQRDRREKGRRYDPTL